MKIGMEPDPIEEFDRQLTRAVGKAVKAKFQHGNVDAALREIERLTRQKLAVIAAVSTLS